MEKREKGYTGIHLSQMNHRGLDDASGLEAKSQVGSEEVFLRLSRHSILHFVATGRFFAYVIRLYSSHEYKPRKSPAEQLASL